MCLAGAPVGASEMNHHVSPPKRSAVAPMKPPTRRAIAKQQTRRRILAAARRLFGELGYERATIRDIRRKHRVRHESGCRPSHW